MVTKELLGEAAKVSPPLHFTDHDMSELASQAISEARFWRRSVSSLLIYREVFQDPVGQAYVTLLEALGAGHQLQSLEAYGLWFQSLAHTNQSWATYLLRRILQDENPFSLHVQQRVSEVPEALLQAAQQDLQILQRFYQLSPLELSRWVQQVCQLPQPPLAWQLPDEAFPGSGLSQLPNWATSIGELTNHYRRHGTGLLSQYRAYRWQQGRLRGIEYPDPVQLENLAAYDTPRQTLIQHTEHFLAGYPALHTLLYGSRGSGKASLIKALLNRYYPRGLRLVEVAKADLRDLPTIVDRLRAAPHRFIVFVDDLSFEDDDEAFKALKVVLEGSVTARPDNVVVYATSNRRHLVREYFAERPRPHDQDDIQAWDTLQEKLSFSDRFGLSLTFEPADQATYLTIVKHLAAQAGITLSETELLPRALQWATRHNGRSGRSARQFIDFLQAEEAMAAYNGHPDKSAQ